MRLKANGNVFVTSSGYAYDACKAASPIHNHPMLKWSKNKNARKQMHVHCWFLKQEDFNNYGV